MQQKPTLPSWLKQESSKTVGPMLSQVGEKVSNLSPIMQLHLHCRIRFFIFLSKLLRSVKLGMITEGDFFSE